MYPDCGAQRENLPERHRSGSRFGKTRRRDALRRTARFTRFAGRYFGFFLGSRYCETDLLSDAAWSRFGQTTPGWSRVQAICDFVHNHIAFDYQKARPTRTAWEAFNEGAGVCRDYAHLAIALCRCMNIPARYCTGYLGDMGTPPPYGVMDFAAWIEVYLGGAWHTFDPRNNVPRIGRVLIARGRDATDVAITTTFGPNTLESFKVWTDEIAESVPHVG